MKKREYVNMKRNWTKLYETYKRNYQKVKNKSEVPMERVYSRYEFEKVYVALEADRMREIKAGTRKRANVTQDLIARQKQYEFSQKQAKVIQKALKERYGEKWTIKEIRIGDARQATEYLFAETGQVSNQGAEVGAIFFGSE